MGQNKPNQKKEYPSTAHLILWEIPVHITLTTTKGQPAITATVSQHPEKIKPFGILTRADVIEFIDFLLNSEEEEVLPDFLLLLFALQPEQLQVMIL